jgi:hypothetical protein
LAAGEVGAGEPDAFAAGPDALASAAADSAAVGVAALTAEAPAASPANTTVARSSAGAASLIDLFTCFPFWSGNWA